MPSPPRAQVGSRRARAGRRPELPAGRQGGRRRSPGVAKVLLADDAAYAHWLAENVAPLVVKLAPAYSHSSWPPTTRRQEPRCRASPRCSTCADLRHQQIVSPDTFVRPIYAGNALATVQSTDKIKVITVRRPTSRPRAGGGSAAIEQIGGEGARACRA